MATLALGLVGQAIGGAIGGSFLGISAAGIGYAAGTLIGNSLQRIPGQEGPRISDLSVSSSSYGTPINKVYGASRINGSIIWSSDIVEVKNTEKVGGKGAPSQSLTTYAYYGNFAVQLCEGPIAAITKIWADNKIIYDSSDNASAESLISSSRLAEGISFYYGTETQEPDPLIESYEGVDSVPAFRGNAYIVFTELALEKFGNRIPNITAEIYSEGYTAKISSVGSIAVNNIASITYQEGIIHSVNMSSPVSAIGTWTHKIFNLSGDIVSQESRDIAVSLWQSNNTNISYCRNNHRISARQRQQAGTGLGVTAFYRDNEFSNYVGIPDGFSDYYSVISSVRAFSFKGDQNAKGYIYLIGVDSIKSVTYLAKYPASGSIVDENLESYIILDDSVGSNSNESVHVSDDGYIYIAGAFNQLTYQGLNKFDGDLNWIDGWSTFPGASSTSDFSVYKNTLLAHTGSAFGSFSFPDTPAGAFAQIGSSLSSAGSNIFYLEGLISISESDFIYSGDVPTESTQSLASIVSDICIDCGLTSGQIDVTALTANTDGFVITRQMQGRAAMEPLRQAFYFDLIESDGKIKAVNRGGGSAYTIPANHLATHTGNEQPSNVDLSITQENELPQRVSITYINRSDDYQPNLQDHSRLLTSSINQVAIQVPISMTDDYAAKMAEILLSNAWSDRYQFSISLPLDYIGLDAGDIITIPYDNDSITVRVVEIDNNGVFLSVKALFDDSDYTSTRIGGSSSGMQQQVASSSGVTSYHLLDINMLRNSDNSNGYYVAASGYTAGWNGAILYHSIDGDDYTKVSSMVSSAVMGSCSNALSEGPNNRIDKANSVNVFLNNGLQTLSSITESQLLAGYNACVIGNEICGFQTAFLESDGSYTLTNLLRARKGSEQEAHASGDRFILLDQSTLIRVSEDDTKISTNRYYKAVSFGSYIQSAFSTSFSNSAKCLKPYSPVSIKGSRDGSNNITITWLRRSRIASRLLWAPVLGEDSESYEIDIVTASSPEVVRTITAATETASYTAAQQTTDGITPGDPVTVRVYQLSATVGRGYTREQII